MMVARALSGLALAVLVVAPAVAAPQKTVLRRLDGASGAVSGSGSSSGSGSGSGACSTFTDINSCMNDLACAWCPSSDTCVADGSDPSCNRLNGNLWAGSYSVDAGCDPSSCCCATGTITITQDTCQLTVAGSQTTTNAAMSAACKATFSWTANQCSDNVHISRASSLGDVTLSKPSIDTLSIANAAKAGCTQTATCTTGACNIVNNILGLAKTIFIAITVGFALCVVAAIVGVYFCCCRTPPQRTYYHMAPQQPGSTVVVGQQVGAAQGGAYGGGYGGYGGGYGGGGGGGYQAGGYQAPQAANAQYGAPPAPGAYGAPAGGAAY